MVPISCSFHAVLSQKTDRDKQGTISTNQHVNVTFKVYKADEVMGENLVSFHALYVSSWNNSFQKNKVTFTHFSLHLATVKLRGIAFFFFLLYPKIVKCRACRFFSCHNFRAARDAEIPHKINDAEPVGPIIEVTHCVLLLLLLLCCYFTSPVNI